MSNNPHTFRNQNLLLGTTFHVMANALCKDERCLDQMEEEKARKVLALSGEQPENIKQVSSYLLPIKFLIKFVIPQLKCLFFIQNLLCENKKIK